LKDINFRNKWIWKLKSSIRLRSEIGVEYWEILKIMPPSMGVGKTLDRVI
jgi:hypothetical protein